jgi:hypothetical protein
LDLLLLLQLLGLRLPLLRLLNLRLVLLLPSWSLPLLCRQLRIVVSVETVPYS